jgi:predicted transcriptional regulator
MSVQRPTTTGEPLPTELDSPRAKLVYLYLRRAEATVDDLQSALGVKKIALYSILRTLRERELVEKRDGRFAVAE